MPALARNPLTGRRWSAFVAGMVLNGRQRGFTGAWQNPRMRRHALAWLCSSTLLLAGLASAATPDRALVFTRTAGWRHTSIPNAVATLQKLAADQGLEVDHSEDAGDFNAANLARYKVVVFASTTGDILDPGQQAALQAFVRGGGGFVGVHAAADTEHDWPWYGQLVGAGFKSHPKGLQSTLVRPELDGKASGTPWPVTDELYNYDHNPRDQMHVLATVDESLYEGGTMGKDHPISWCHAFEGGRSWYTGLGHDDVVYADPNFLEQLRRGLSYAIRKSDDC